MRLIAIAAVAAVLLIPAAPSQAGSSPAFSTTHDVDVSAAKKRAKKAKAKKDEYMRAVPSR